MIVDIDAEITFWYYTLTLNGDKHILITGILVLHVYKCHVFHVQNISIDMQLKKLLQIQVYFFLITFEMLQQNAFAFFLLFVADVASIKTAQFA